MGTFDKLAYYVQYVETRVNLKWIFVCMALAHYFWKEIVG